MRLPIKHLKIGDHRFSVRFGDCGECFGMLCFDAREILLDRKLCATPRNCFDTLAHEAMHAALHVAGVSFGETYDEETIVRAMDHLFLPALSRIIAAYDGRFPAF